MKRNGIAQKKWTKINVQFSFPQNSFVKRPPKNRLLPLCCKSVFFTKFFVTVKNKYIMRQMI